jgi:hypothetical protein
MSADGSGRPRKRDDRLWLLGIHHFNPYLLIGSDRTAKMERRLRDGIFAS